MSAVGMGQYLLPARPSTSPWRTMRWRFPSSGAENPLSGPRSFPEAVKAAPASRVRLELNTPTSPCLILPQEGEADNFLYMVLPVRLKAGE